MSLVEDIKAALDAGNDIDELIHEVSGLTLVEDTIHDTSRWSIIHQAVFVRSTLRPGTDPVEFDTEYAMVEYHEPATEYQDWDSLDDAEVFPVEPYEEVVVKWRPA